MVAETADGLSGLLQLFRDRRELSRVEVIERSGLSRSTVNHRLAALTESGLISALDGGTSTGGRPSTRFAFNSARAAVLCVDVGASGFVAAICDLSGRPLRQLTTLIDVWEGPERVLKLVADAFTSLQRNEEVWGVGIGVPGPVEFAAGRVVNPPIMTGWDGFDISGWIRDRYPGINVVENDVNARAVAESRLSRQDNLIALKLGTGIGAGLVFHGQIIRGSDGAAGDIGHTHAGSPSSTPADVICRCGNTGCVEAYASGWALVRDLAAAGIPVDSVSGVVELVLRGEREAVRLVRNAGRVVGEAVATMVSVLNPAMIVLSGQLAACDEILLAGIRERIYQRALPLATRKLQIRRSDLGESAGVTGLALITAGQLLSPAGFEDRMTHV